MTENTITLHSKLDPSVNTYRNGFETRFVVRDDSFIIYLSSFKGCDQACRMCHLTQTAQTDMTPATTLDFIDQAMDSLQEAKKYMQDNGLPEPKCVHFNFMARGEPLLNPTVMGDWTTLSNALASESIAVFPSANIKFKISTIMTGVFKRDENNTIIGGYTSLPFQTNKPEIYYSIYSLDPEFRKRWLPKAEEPREMLRLLSNYVTKGGEVRFHNAYILGHNDDLVDVQQVLSSINFFGLPKKYNIVRFNSPDESRWVETPEEHLNEIKKYMESKGFDVQMVDRVGFDVAASCGMFISPGENND